MTTAPTRLDYSTNDSEFYRQMVETVQDYAILRLDLDGRVASWNAGAQRIKGYTADEIIGQHFSVFYPPEDVVNGKTELELREAAQTGRFEDEGYRVRKDGSQFWANVVFTALYDADGKLTGYSKMTRDITDRKRDEETMRLRAVELETVAKIAAATVTNLNIEDVLQSASDLTKENFGLYHAHVYLLDDAGEQLVLVAGAGEPGRIMKAEGRSIAVNNEGSLVARAARTRAAVIVNDVRQVADFLPNKLLPNTRSEMAVPMVVGDQLVGVLDVQSDKVDNFTAEKARIKLILGNQIAAAVQNARAYQIQVETGNQIRTYQQMVESVQDYAILRLNPHGYVASWNAGAQRIKGYTADEIIGQHFSVFYTPEDVANGKTEHELQVTAATGRFEDEGYRVRKDGSQFWANVVFTALYDADGNLTGYSKVTRDLTDRKREEEIMLQRAVELETVAKISAATVTNLHIDEVLQTASELTKENFGLYHAHIYLLDDAGERLVLAAGAGEPGRIMKAEGRSIAVNNEGSLVARAARMREAVIVNDVRQVADFLPNKLLPNTRSEMAVPMVVGDQLVGVLDVQSDKVDNFTAEKARIKLILGNQIAAAVQNSRAYTEIEKAEASLSATVGQLSSINKALDEFAIVSITDVRGTIEFVNDNFCNISGYSREELIGQDHRIVNSTYHPKEYVRNMWVTIANGNIWNGEFRNKAKDGHYYWVDTTMVPVLNEQGKPVKYIAIRRDVTERKHIEEQINARAAELEAVAKVGTAAATVLDLNELLQFVSDLTKENFGLYHAHVYLLDDAAEHLVLAAGAGEPGRIMKAEGRSIAVSNEGSLVARAARTREAVIVNDVRQVADFLPNKLLPNTRSEMAVPMVVGDQLVGVLDVQSDRVDNFTKEKARIKMILGNQIATAVQNARSYEFQIQTTEQLRTLDRLKSEFLASMSHELRTPLNSVIGYSRMLLDGSDGELPEEVTEDISAIHNSGQHLLHMINDILDLAKIEAERMELDQEMLPLDVVSNEVRQMTSIFLQDKPVSLVLDFDPNLPEIWADRVRLRQILNNLVSNAIKFTEQGEVRIYAKHDETTGMVMIAVQDTGIGIPSDQVNRVFERFHQTDGSSTRKAGGTGLGLTITRHLVELHGGQVWAESVLGKGSTFWFTMPTSESVA